MDKTYPYEEFLYDTLQAMFHAVSSNLLDLLSLTD